jgi:hypothetical protein
VERQRRNETMRYKQATAVTMQHKPPGYNDTRRRTAMSSRSCGSSCMRYAKPLFSFPSNADAGRRTSSKKSSD